MRSALPIIRQRFGMSDRRVRDIKFYTALAILAASMLGLGAMALAPILSAGGVQ